MVVPVPGMELASDAMLRGRDNVFSSWSEFAVSKVYLVIKHIRRKWILSVWDEP